MRIKISGFRTDTGRALISVFDQAEGFPGESKMAVYKEESVIINGKAEINLSRLPAGRYAVAILHDENNNLKMDLNFLGIPKEGFGVSNNVKPVFGAPSFEKAAFELNDSSHLLNIKIGYY